MLCLPSHTTHEVQPLECTVFSPFKAKWRTVCHEYFQANPGKIITNHNFVNLSKGFMQAITPANLVAGIKSCDVHSLDSSAIQTLVSESNRGSSASQAQQSKRQRTKLNNDFSGNTASQDQQLQSNDSSAIQSRNCADNQATVAHSNNDDGIDNTFADGSNSFTAEQEELFKKR